jgi:hypothetical protein
MEDQMQRSDMEALISALGVTAEIMGTQFQSAALTVMASDLSKYKLVDVLAALERVRKEVSGRLTLAAIIDRIQSSDGAPGSDEAWALMSRPESDTIVITRQMAEAMQIARPLLADGDKIGARMAFKDAYTRIVADSRERRIEAEWFVSLGFDTEGRAQPIADAIRSGKLSLTHSLKLLSPAGKAEVLELTGNMNHPLLVEFKQSRLEEKRPRDPNGRKHFEELKDFLKRKAG